MRNGKTRALLMPLGLLLGALILLPAAGAAEHRVPPPVPTPPEPLDAEPPEPPIPPMPPELSVRGFTIRHGETHKGNVVRFAPSATIEGKLDGDMYMTAPTVHISGVVTGDVFVAGSEVDVTGEIKKSFRAAAGNVVIDGTVDGNVLVTGGSVTLSSKAVIHGNVSSYSGQLTHHGTIDGSLTFTGGTVILGGKVLEDATVTADAIHIEPGARIEGDVTYSTRKPMDAELKAIAGGSVVYDEAPVREKKKRAREERPLRPTTFGVGKWIAFFTASFLFGCGLLAVFGAHEPKVTAAIGTDALRCIGIGFVSILVTIAVLLSVILIITIPFILVYVLAYIVVAYLAKIPVAIWVGRFVFEKARRPSGPYTALLVGLVVLYLVFMLPYLGVLAQLGAALLGLGAMTMTYLAHRQARRVVPPTV